MIVPTIPRQFSLSSGTDRVSQFQFPPPLRGGTIELSRMRSGGVEGGDPRPELSEGGIP